MRKLISESNLITLRLTDPVSIGNMMSNSSAILKNKKVKEEERNELIEKQLLSAKNTQEYEDLVVDESELILINLYSVKINYKKYYL